MTRGAVQKDHIGNYFLRVGAPITFSLHHRLRWGRHLGLNALSLLICGINECVLT